MAVGDHSHLDRFKPRLAAVAATSKTRQYQQAVLRARKMAYRRHLPLTQQDFYTRQQAAK